MASKLSVSDKINKIRRSAGWDGSTCPTCTRSCSNPYRRHDAHGKVIEGCVDACHTGRLVSPSESNRWQNSKAAESIRRRELESLTGMYRPSELKKIFAD